MSSNVLARKYRPRDFAGMVGQEHVVTALSNALTQQRLHHAYLFTGTRGVGKTTVSRILAKSLNCTGPDGGGGISANPCGVCPSCKAIDAGRFVDYVELDAASNRGVDEIGQLLDQAVYKPVLGRFKVYMIDEVHMLTTHAFNAMLKTLEEPPDYLKFVLATTDPQKVPPTVLSRCLQFNLRPMSPDTVQRHLAEVLTAENVPSEPGALKLLARGARGSMRDGLSLTDQAIAFGSGEVREAAVRSMLGAVDRRYAVALLDALASGDGRALVQACDGLRAAGLSARGTVDELIGLLQRMAIAHVAPEALDATDAEEADAARLAAVWPADELQLVYSLLLQGQAELHLAPDEHTGLMMLLLRSLVFRPADRPVAGTPSEPSPAARPVALPLPSRQPVAAQSSAPRAPEHPEELPHAALREAPSVRNASAEIAAPAAPRAQPLVVPAPRSAAPVAAAFAQPTAAVGKHNDVTTVGQGGASGDQAARWCAWAQALIDANAVQALARELALQAQCVSLVASPTSTEVRLRVEREPLRAAGPVDKLTAALAAWLGHAVTIEVEPGAVDDSLALQIMRRREARQREAEATIHNDPLVLQVLQEFQGAQVVPGSVRPL